MKKCLECDVVVHEEICTDGYVRILNEDNTFHVCLNQETNRDSVKADTANR